MRGSKKIWFMATRKSDYLNERDHDIDNNESAKVLIILLYHYYPLPVTKPSSYSFALAVVSYGPNTKFEK